MVSTDDLLKFDSLATAEKATGKSYKEDDATMQLGLLLQLTNVAARREALTANDDTFYSCRWDDTFRIYQELGFTNFYRESFPGTYAEETHHLLWHADGILATLESYSWRSGDKNVNNTKIYFNWKPNDVDDAWDLRFSGHFVDDVLVGDIDTREGLRHTLSKMRSIGTFVRPWVEPPYFYLANYIEWKEKGCDYKKITQAKLEQLPESVQEAMGL